MPPRSSDASSGSFLPRITGQSSVPRQPIAPSGLRAPRPVMLSKLPVVARCGRSLGAISRKNLETNLYQRILRLLRRKLFDIAVVSRTE
ncbi:hypothetical protein GQ600_10150 [Phytophthora cactorum]|nr:hypothetical protein GQ600_10150 [Phytophthora cactorum]